MVEVGRLGTAAAETGDGVWVSGLVLVTPKPVFASRDAAVALPFGLFWLARFSSRFDSFRSNSLTSCLTRSK